VSLAPDQYARTLLHGLVDELLDDLYLECAGHGADVDWGVVLGARHPLSEVARDLDGACDEGIVDIVEDENPFGGEAALPGSDEAADERRVHGLVELGIVADDQGVFAAELENRRRDRLGALGDDLLAIGLRAGEDDFVNAAGDQCRTGLSVAVDDLDEVRAEAGPLEGLVEDLLDSRRRPGNPLTDLADDCVAGRERRNGGSEHILQRIVPGRDDTDHAERLVVNRRLLVQQQTRRDPLRCQVAFSVLHRVPQLLAHRPDLAHHCVLAGLACVSDDHIAECIGVRQHVIENTSQDLSALGVRGRAPGSLSDAGTLHSVTNGGRPVDRDLAERLERGGVVAWDDPGALARDRHRWGVIGLRAWLFAVHGVLLGRPERALTSGDAAL